MTTPMVRAFPSPGVQIKQLYRELNIAANGTDSEKKALGPLEDLPRPWNPATVTRSAQRSALWAWLDAVVLWLNDQYVFDPADLVPPCWPQHPHLVHELAAVADLRYRADLDLNPTTLEEWHRYALPAFLDRMRRRLVQHCEGGHPDHAPSHRSLVRYKSEESSQARWNTFRDDLSDVSGAPTSEADHVPRLHLVDVDSGEVID